MSWSIRLIGKPANVAKAIEEYSAKLDGQSKIEFDIAMPHLIGLIRQNFVSDKALAIHYVESSVELEASGSGSCVDGEQIQRTCIAKIGISYAKLV